MMKLLLVVACFATLTTVEAVKTVAQCQDQVDSCGILITDFVVKGNFAKAIKEACTANPNLVITVAIAGATKNSIAVTMGNKVAHFDIKPGTKAYNNVCSNP